MNTGYPDLSLEDFRAAMDRMQVRTKDGPQGETHWDYRARSVIMPVTVVGGWVVAEQIVDLCRRLGIDVDAFYQRAAAGGA